MSKSKSPFRSLKYPEIISKVGSPFNPSDTGKTGDFFDSGYEILINSGDDMDRVIPLNSKEIKLGRKDHPHERRAGYILFSDSTVSRDHAVIRWDDELEKYVIYHLSKSTPTLVNGRAVKKSLLSPDYRVQLGDLVFQMVSIKEKHQKESSAMWERFKAGEERGDEYISSGYKLVVVDGPDSGQSFDLDKNLMIIGRRKGMGDIRDTYGILLSDETLPDELALLVWNEQEGRFGIFQSEESPVPIRLFRVVETHDGSQVVGREYQNILEDKDSIMAGETVMVVHRLSPDETMDAKVDISKELKTEAPQVSEDEGTLTVPGSFRIDYMFEVIEGPGKGQKISLLSDEMSEGRIVSFGSRGPTRQNDIELEDLSLTNTQGYYEFTGGNLYLINESGNAPVMVNNYNIGENEKIVLNGGDHIRLGETILTFTDNRIIAALRNYALIVAVGEDEDKGRRFPLTRTTVLIGRGSVCDIRVYDPEVSRIHAALTFKAGRFHLEHKSKVNPTFVNGISLKKGQSRIVFPGDKIYLSGTTILQLVRAVA
ncbi:MAG: FHA domain-containing protein [Firmicutes bacterium]|nr:FHA domain-containing protein [Bacillota bacterium]